MNALFTDVPLPGLASAKAMRIISRPSLLLTTLEAS